MNQATEPAVGSIEQQAEALAQYELRLKRQQEELAAIEGRVSAQRQRLANTEQAVVNARNLLGKTKLTEAISLVVKVATEAPKGSDAANDIDALAHRLMQRSVNQVFKDMPFESTFAKAAGRAPGKPSAIGELTATALASMTTSVGAGQPRQAKPTPWIPKVGDKVRLVRAWYDGSKPYVGKVLTVDKLSGGTYLYFTEFPHGQNCTVDHVEPAGDFRVGDKVVYVGGDDYEGWCGEAAMGRVLTVSRITAQTGTSVHLRLKELEEQFPNHSRRHSAFKYA